MPEVVAGSETMHISNKMDAISIFIQGSKFHLSVSPGQVHFPPDNKITKVCCPSDNQVAAAGSSLSGFSVRF